MTKLRKQHKHVIERIRIDPYGEKLFNLGLENDFLGLRPREVFSRPRAQCLPKRTS